MSKRKKRDGIVRRKASQFWWCTYVDSSGKRVRRSTGTTSKREAIAIRNKWLAEEWNKQAHDIQPDRSFGQLAVMYLQGTKDIKRSHGTDIKRMKALRKFFPVNLLMNNLTSDDVRGYIAHRLQKGIENKTINKELSLLSAAIKWCNQQLDWELPNPVVGKRLPEVVKEARCLTLAEFKKLMASVNACWSSHTRNYLPEFCILGYNTMMRPGEMLELEWSRVDFVNSTVVLDVEDTKGKQRRLVPLNDAAKAALLKLKRIADDNFPDTQYVFTHTRPRSKGQRIQTVTKVWATAVKRAGIAWATPHCLRHTAITESVHVPNANVVDISRVAGHKDLKTTLGYIHVAPDRLHQTVANLPTLGTF